MRRYIKQLLILAFFGIFAMPHTMTAQQSPAERLVGTWQFDDTSSFAKMNAESMQHLDTVPQLKAQVMAAYSGRRLFISPDGTYTVSLTDGRSASSDWSLTGDGTLVLTDPSGNTSYETIKVLTNKHLVLVPKVERDMRNIVEEQHYTKQ